MPNSPLTFLKPSTAVIGPGENIIYPSASARVDYEGELAVIIKRPVWRVSVEDALDYVLGYACFNDVTARDLQNYDGQWTRAKGFDTFAAIGPWIETELDPSNLVLETYLNGELKQQGNTADLIYSIPEIINFISNVMTCCGGYNRHRNASGVGPCTPAIRWRSGYRRWVRCATLSFRTAPSRPGYRLIPPAGAGILCSVCR